MYGYRGETALRVYAEIFFETALINSFLFTGNMDCSVEYEEKKLTDWF